MTPEIALLIRAALLSLLVLAVERFANHRQVARREARRTVVKLPATLNPVVTLAPGRPLQVNPAHPAFKASATEHLEVVQLEPRRAFVEKQAA
jgi:hypothetical protein